VRAMVASIITGRDVRRIREALRLPVAQFATVLGVHASSVHRWEAAEAARIPIEGVPLTVLTALRARVHAEATRGRKVAAKGEEVSNALATGGALVALAILLMFAAGREK